MRGGCDSIITINLVLDTLDLGVVQNGATLTANQAIGNFQWLDCDDNFSAIAGANSSTFTATQNGNYAVQIIFGNCRDTSDCFEVSNIGIATKLQSYHYVVFPNPFEDKVHVKFQQSEKNVQVRLFNIEGKQIFFREYFNEKQLSLDLPFPSGMYYMLVETEDYRKGQKIIKQ